MNKKASPRSRSGFVRSVFRFFRKMHFRLFSPDWMKKYERFDKH